MPTKDRPRENAPGVRAFMDAVRNGDNETVRGMATTRPEIVHARDYDSYGATALIHASDHGHYDTIRLLLDLGADIQARSDWWAGSFGVLPCSDPAMTRFLIDHGATVDAHTAASMGDVETLRALLDADATLIHARGGDGQFPLHYASTAAVVDLLLERGADLDARCIDHESTAVQYATSARPVVARHLLERGASSDPILAVALGDLALLQDLIAAEPGILRIRIDESGLPTSDNTPAQHIYTYTLGYRATLLHVAARGGHLAVARWLLDQGLDTNITGGYDECTPLHLAAWNDHPEVASLLLDRGADLERLSGAEHQNQPLGWAVVAGREAMVALFIARGARVFPHHLADAENASHRETNWTNVPRENFVRIANQLRPRV